MVKNWFRSVLLGLALAIGFTPVSQQLFAASVGIAPDAKLRFFDNNGVMLSGGKLFTYAAGTTNKQNTYTDSTGSTPNQNPIILDSYGYATVWIDQTLQYKFTLSPSTDTDPPTNTFWTIDNLNGPNSPGYLALLTYESSVAASSGSSLVGFINIGTNTGARTLQAKARDTVSAFDFTDGSGHYFAAVSTAAQNAAALQSAINTFGTAGNCLAGGKVIIPPGSFTLASDTITFPCPNVTLEGAGNSVGYGLPAAGTNILFAAGTVGFNMTAVTGNGGAGNYTTLRDMSISGNTVCAYPIKVVGFVLLEHLNVTGSTAGGAGIWLYDLVNQTRLSHVSVVGNLGYGLLVGDLGSGTGANTIMSIDHFNARSNLVGVRIEQATGLTMKDAVIEANTNEGLVIYQRTGKTVTNLEFDNVWLENNWVGGGATNYNLVIDSDSHVPAAAPSFLIFRQPHFSASGSTKAVNVIAAQTVNFLNTSGVGAITLGLGSAGVSVYNNNAGVITNSSQYNWTGGDGGSSSQVPGPNYSGLNVNSLNVLGPGTLVSAADSTPALIYNMLSPGTGVVSKYVRYYQVFVRLDTDTGASTGVTDYSAYALIAADKTTSRILHQVNGGKLTITIGTGATFYQIYATQTSGTDQNLEFAVTPFMSSVP